MTSLFNGYYNGERKWREGVKEIDETFRIAPSGYIPILYTGSEEDAKTYGSTFDESIKKCEVVLLKHPNSNWKDDCFYLMGRGWFYKKNYILAKQDLEWVIANNPDSKLLPQVYLWLVKTLYLSGSEATAKQVLEKDLPNQKLSKRDQGELALLRAQMQLDAENLPEVVEILERNMSNIKGKLNRARTHFLLGQIYADQDRLSKSYEHYKKVTRINADYQLIFNAKIRIAKLFINQTEGTDETQRIAKLLKKMLRDEKNIDYRDQIYYELAMLDLKKGNQAGAIENLKNSIRLNTSNQRQKALSYYRIGNIYFKDLKDFTMAQAYFDSASQAITEDAPEYFEISNISSTLKEYINYVNTIHYQDSMVTLGKMGKEQLDKHVDFIIAEEKRREQERLRKEQEEVDMMRDPNLFNQFGERPSQGGSSFYFDDPQLISNGRQQFERTWGRRKNEDNWRRKNKNLTVSSNEEEEKQDLDQELVKQFGDKAKYYKDIPKNEEEIAAANDKIAAAMYGLGQVYQNRLMIPDSATATYKKLIKRYPDDDYTLKALYALYKMNETKDPRQADDYKSQICTKSPRSIYCKLCNNELIPEEMNEEMEAFKSAYTALFTTFSDKDYSTCLDFSRFILDKWFAAPEIPKVLYLRGLAFGYLGQRDSLKSTFQYLKKNFPDTEQSAIATRTLALLEQENNGSSQNNGTPTNNNNGGTPNGGNNNGEVVSSSDPRFEGFEPDKKSNEKVYVTMLVKKEGIQNQQLQMLLNDFNKQYFSSENLTVSIFFYQRTHHLAYVSQFEDYQQAFNYMSMAMKDEKIAGAMADPSDRIVFITPQNFRVAYGKKRFEDYLVYFDNVVLKSLNGK